MEHDCLVAAAVVDDDVGVVVGAVGMLVAAFVGMLRVVDPSSCFFGIHVHTKNAALSLLDSWCLYNLEASVLKNCICK